MDSAVEDSLPIEMGHDVKENDSPPVSEIANDEEVQKVSPPQDNHEDDPVKGLVDVFMNDLAATLRTFLSAVNKELESNDVTLDQVYNKVLKNHLKEVNLCWTSMKEIDLPVEVDNEDAIHGVL